MYKKFSLFSIILVFSLHILASVAKADYLFVSHQAFTGSSHTEGYERTSDYTYKAQYSGSLQAPIYLPDGAIIRGFHLIYYDREFTFGVSAKLIRINPWNGTRKELFACASTGTSVSIRWVSSYTLNEGTRKVMNKSFTYWVEVNFQRTGDSLRVHGVRIQYSMPAH
ncbi:MAG: hypothetical protein JSV17_10565 [Candidatus Aminicenantes bacterium]|nr:MAG: hypothetical protein JSV17_10565 [Candidatus Aminicenantes bacterium]